MIQLIGKGINRVSTPKNLFYHNIANTINTADEKVIHKEERIFQGHHVVQAHTYTHNIFRIKQKMHQRKCMI